MSPWERFIQCAPDHFERFAGPTPEQIKEAVADSVELQYVIANGVSALDRLLSDYGDEMGHEDAASLARLLASLGAATLRLRIFEDGIAEIRTAEKGVL